MALLVHERRLGEKFNALGVDVSQEDLEVLARNYETFRRIDVHDETYDFLVEEIKLVSRKILKIPVTE